jgi:hypothetical protein
MAGYATVRVLPTYPTTRYDPAPLIDLTSRSERDRLSASVLKAFFRIVDRWGIRDEGARSLLGGISNGPYYTWKKQPEGLLDADVLTSNRVFGGQTPLYYMIRGGVPAMQIVRHLLDARCGGL